VDKSYPLVYFVTVKIAGWSTLQPSYGAYTINTSVYRRVLFFYFFSI